MKRNLSLFFILIISLGVSAQSVDLDKYTFTASYRQLPRGGLDTSFHTFSIHIDPGRISSYIMKGEQMEDLVSIAGWKKLQYDAHMQIDVKVEDVLVEKTDIQPQEEILRDKNGKEIGKKINYFVVATYTYGAEAKLTDYRGRLIEIYKLANRMDKNTHKSTAFTSEAEALAYSRYGYLLITNNIMKLTADRIVQNLNNTLSYNYGYSENYVSDFLWILDSKRHPEYEAHRRAWVIFKEAMIKMSYDQPLDEVKETMKPVIDYFIKVKKIYSSRSKGDRKMRYASCFNLAKIYYYLDDPDNAMIQASELVMNDYDSRDGKYLENWATSLKQLFRDTKLKTRHFPMNIEDTQGPAVMSSSTFY